MKIGKLDIKRITKDGSGTIRYTQTKILKDGFKSPRFGLRHWRPLLHCIRYWSENLDPSIDRRTFLMKIDLPALTYINKMEAFAGMNIGEEKIRDISKIMIELKRSPLFQ